MRTANFLGESEDKWDKTSRSGEHLCAESLAHYEEPLFSLLLGHLASLQRKG